jgi:hypothetical protein
MLPCVVTDFFLITNRRTINPTLFCHKTLHVSGKFFDHHQESPTAHSDMVIANCSMKLTNAECAVGDS